MTAHERLPELLDDVAKIAPRMRDALRRDLCAKLKAMPIEARQKLRERLAASLPVKAKHCADSLCAAGDVYPMLASDADLAELVDSGAVVEHVLGATGGVRRSFLSLQTA